MGLQLDQLVKLAKTAARAKDPSTSFSWEGNTYSHEAINEALRVELKELAPNYRTYKINQNTIFALMEEVIDDVVPEEVIKLYSQFADIKTFNQGDKPIFTQKITTAARRRAKQFIGTVGLAGRYEVFKLDGRSYEVTTNAIGGAAQIGFEEFLDGRVDFADVLDIVLEGIDECIYLEIEAQLEGAVANMQGSNKVSNTSFVESDMDYLIGIADSYGHSTIYCTWEFASTMWPSDARMSDDMKNQRWTGSGCIATYKGHNVVILPQSYNDETNTHKVINPGLAYIIPVGSEKPVKIAIEGGAIVKEFENYDYSSEVQIYKKIGVRAIFSPAICVYENTNLTR